MSKITRRDFLKYSAYGSASLVVSSGLMSCGDNSSSSSSPDNAEPIAMSFSHGVASGDPLSDRVIIWTRALPDDEVTHSSLTVSFEIATDENFTNITNNGEATVTGDTDFTLKVDAQNLTAQTEYYYRFSSNGVTSPVGNTKTLPELSANVDQVKLAVMSCSNYPTGFFNVYAEANTINDLDAVLHLGDYIYEYKSGEYATENAERLGRQLADDNDVELIELVDYRKRYALYRSDPDLQSLHQMVSFIVVPDDHEVANDTYINGAENHDDATEGDFNTRKLNALQAYFEWLPIRPATENDQETLYRHFQWGNLVNLIMLDTRLIGRSEQLPGLDDPVWYPGGIFDVAAFQAALFDSTRTMLGADQLAWLTNAMSSSNSLWQVLGQQVLMGRMNLPIEILTPGADPAVVLPELVAIKLRIQANDPTVTPEEEARLAAAPYNLDAWDGYGYEREQILEIANNLNKNLVVLAGDTHNAWANNLRKLNGDSVGVEFATASVTSPGLEDFLGLDLAGAIGFEQSLQILVDDLQYTNFFDRGLMITTFTADSAVAEWRFVDTIESTVYTVNTSRGKQLKADLGQNLLSDI